MKRKKINALFVLLAAAISLLVLWAVQRLLVPKYMGMVVEGNLTGEYYKEVPDHDVLILGNCEAYENISPAVLWRDRKSTRLNSSHSRASRMPSSA